MFPLYTCLAFIDLARSRKSIGILMGIVALSLIYFGSFSFMLKEGYMEFGMAFFALTPAYCLFLANTSKNAKKIKRYLVVGALLACGSAVTKQAGLYWLLLYPLMSYLTVVKYQDFSRGEKIKLLLIYLAIISVIVVPFYVYSRIRILNRLDTSEIEWVTNGIYGGKTNPFLRLYSGVNLLLSVIPFHKFRPVGFLIISILCFLSLSDKVWRPIFLLVGPYVFIWARFFSYDIRNCIVLFPYVAIAVGIGLEKVLERGIYTRIARIRNVHILIMAAAVLMFAASRIDSTYLKEKHRHLMAANGATGLLIASQWKNILADYEK